MPLPIYKFLVLPGGGHVDENRTFLPGAKFESYKQLDRMFSNRFELLDSDADIPEENQLPLLYAEGEERVPQKAESTPTDSKTKEGLDVTEDFEGAKDLGVRVIKNGKLFSVFDAQDSSAPLEGGGSLKSKAAVTEFIDSLGAA
jgi:hypothetical protein